MILAQVKQVRRRHRGNRGVKEFAAERRLRHGYCRFQPVHVAKVVGTALPLNLLIVNFQDLVKREEQRVHALRAHSLREFLECLRISLVSPVLRRDKFLPPI